MYITLAELAKRPGPRELAQVASTALQAGRDDALMEATLVGADRSAWTTEQCLQADQAKARILDAVAEAGALIDGFVAQRGYALPLVLPATSSGKGVLTAWARSITRYLLNQSRITDESKDPIARDYRDALKMLGLLSQGKFSLGGDDPAAPQAAAGTDVRFDGAPTVFGRDQLRSFR